MDGRQLVDQAADTLGTFSDYYKNYVNKPRHLVLNELWPKIIKPYIYSIKIKGHKLVGDLCFRPDFEVIDNDNYRDNSIVGGIFLGVKDLSSLDPDVKQPTESDSIKRMYSNYDYTRGVERVLDNILIPALKKHLRILENKPDLKDILKFDLVYKGSYADFNEPHIKIFFEVNK